MRRWLQIVKRWSKFFVTSAREEAPLLLVGGDGNRTLEALNLGDQLRETYRRRPLLGTFLIELPALRTVRAIALAGYDFIVLDLEHSPFGTETLHSLVAEALAAGIPPIVRVWTADPGLIGKVLDLGIAGVMVPRISSAAEARAAVQATRYSPTGDRGMAPLISFSASPKAQAVVGQSPIVILQLESKRAIEEAAEMMTIPGLDALFIGPYDLSQAMGQPGNVNSHEVRHAADSIASRATDGLMLGVYIDDPKWSAEWVDRGFRLQCLGFDGRMLLQGASSTLAIAKESHDR